MKSEPKQIIVMRTDLGMRRGKQIAQGAHASLKVILDHQSDENWTARDIWLATKFAKICVRADSEDELWRIFEAALNANVHASMIIDEGRTEFHGEKTATCMAIGPEFPDVIDPITGHLKLL